LIISTADIWLPRAEPFDQQQAAAAPPAAGAAAHQNAAAAPDVGLGSDDEGDDVNDGCDDDLLDGYEGVAASYLREVQQQAADLHQQFVDLSLDPVQQRELYQLLQQVQIQAAAHLQSLHNLQQQQEQQQEDEEQAEEARLEPDPAAAAEIAQRAEKLREERNHPLYSGCSLNALQGMFMLFDWRHRYNVTDGAFDELLQMLHSSLLPDGNRMPGSLYLLRKTLNVKRPSDYEYHACLSDKCWWAPLPRSKWSLTSPDCQPCKCGHPRLVEVQLAGDRKQLQPAGRVSAVKNA
jgi:hypothetical protein